MDLDGLHPNSGETPIRHEGHRSGRWNGVPTSVKVVSVVPKHNNVTCESD